MALREKVFPGVCPLRKTKLCAMDHTMQQQQVGFISEGSIKQTVLLLLQFKTLKYVSQLKEFYGK